MPLTPQVDLGLEERQQRCKACRNCIVSIHGIAQRIQPAAKLLAKEQRQRHSRRRPGSAGPSLSLSLADVIEIFRGTYDGTFPGSF